MLLGKIQLQNTNMMSLISKFIKSNKAAGREGWGTLLLSAVKLHLWNVSQMLHYERNRGKC